MADAATTELAVPITEDLVVYALEELRRDGLLEAHTEAAPVAAVSRRTLMRTLGASAVVLLPGVAAVLAPKAAQAYTGCDNCAISPAQRAAAKRAQQAVSAHDDDSLSNP